MNLLRISQTIHQPNQFHLILSCLPPVFFLPFWRLHRNLKILENWWQDPTQSPSLATQLLGQNHFAIADATQHATEAHYHAFRVHQRCDVGRDPKSRRFFVVRHAPTCPKKLKPNTSSKCRHFSNIQPVYVFNGPESQFIKGYFLVDWGRWMQWITSVQIINIICK